MLWGRVFFFTGWIYVDLKCEVVGLWSFRGIECEQHVQLSLSFVERASNKNCGTVDAAKSYSPFTMARRWFYLMFETTSIL